MVDSVTAIAGLLAVGGSIAAIGAKRLMRGVLGLSLTFLGIAILCWRMGAPFLAAAQALVFLGGVVALLVLAFSGAPTPMQRGGIVVGGTVALVTLAILLLSLPAPSVTQTSLSLFELAQALFAQHSWSLHAALLILLAGVIGSQYLLEEHT